MKKEFILAVLLTVVTAVSAQAELQNVEVGGSIRIRGNYFNMDSVGSVSTIEQRTRLNVKADFTSDVSAFIEFDYYDNWGEDFRSNYLTGADLRAGQNDVELYQAYIEARNLWGSPLTARIGRQELKFGNEWLVGVNNASSLFTGLSFDALRLTYTHDLFTLDAVAAKLAESFGDFGEDDTDFYALYFSYLGIENITLDAYWMYVRDDGVQLEGDSVDLHTLGLRGAGTIGAFDFNLEAAYQLGDVEGRPSACPYGFGEADIEYDTFGINAEAGYTFDMAMSPRIFARFAYFGGGDPEHFKWYTNDRELPFNRLFSNWEYTEFFANTDESNLLYYALGIGAMPTETISLQLIGAYFEADESPGDNPGLSSNVGWEVALYANYNYSEDLIIRAGYAHFFGEKGLEGNYIIQNGLVPFAGDRDDDYDFLFLETELAF